MTYRGSSKAWKHSMVTELKKGKCQMLEMPSLPIRVTKFSEIGNWQLKAVSTKRFLLPSKKKKSFLRVLFKKATSKNKPKKKKIKRLHESETITTNLKIRLLFLFVLTSH